MKCLRMLLPELNLEDEKLAPEVLNKCSQLAAEKFADAIETIPLVLAENTGMDPLDTQVHLRAKATTAKPKYGIDVLNAKVADLSAKDIYEPLTVKEHVINGATEAACMILRIDDVITAPKPKTPTTAGGSSGGGAGGMPGNGDDYSAGGDLND